MKKTNYILGLLFIATMSSLTSCEKKSSAKVQKIYNPDETSANSPVTSGNVHVDNDYKYESRTGTSGNYEYNYDVSGDGVEGNVDMQGKYGSGTITDENGDEKDVDVEWVDYGVMEATDDDGNTYTMEAD